MKRILFLLVSIPLFTKLSAQTALPYYTGFDNAAERAGWMEFRKGVTTYPDWQIGPSDSASSAPNTLSHDYPVGAASTDTTIDWFVSPPFSFHAGGRIDSISVNVYDIMGHASPIDSIVVYLLKGSNNPSLASSKTRLADLTGMTSGSSAMRDTGNFIIPPTPGLSYIAFKYYVAGIDWFIPSIDNIHISGLPTTNVAEPGAVVSEFSMYPNPAHTTISVLLTSPPENARIEITDMTGRVLISDNINQVSTTVDVSALSRGIYVCRVTSGPKQYLQKLTITNK